MKAVAVSAPPGLNKIFYKIIKQNGTYQYDRFRFIFYNLTLGKGKRIIRKVWVCSLCCFTKCFWGYIVYYSVCQATCMTED